MVSAALASEPSHPQRWAAELLGAFWLVLGGCGTAVLAGDDVGNLGVALAFGLAVLTGAYAFGPVSGGHFNPAVTVGMAVAKKFAWRDVIGYVISQVLGAPIAATLLFAIASNRTGFDATRSGFASNGFGDRSPDGYGLVAVVLTELVMTAVFLFVILGVSDERAAVGLNGVSIGLALTLIHLVSINVSNTSVNPARSLGVAFYAGPHALAQVAVFVVAPLAGAVIAGFVHSRVFEGWGPAQDATDERKQGLAGDVA